MDASTAEPSAAPTVTRHLRITGRVQGVGFRMFMTREALAAGVTGWVRNRRDGSVEAMLAGEEIAVIKLISWARRGPPRAQVERVNIAVGEGEFEGFEQRASD